MKFKILTPLFMDGRNYAQDDVVDLCQADADGLLACKAIEPCTDGEKSKSKRQTKPLKVVENIAGSAPAAANLIDNDEEIDESDLDHGEGMADINANFKPD